MNIAGIVIVYHPDIQVLCDNIKTYVQGLRQLYVYDNSELPSPDIEKALWEVDTSIQYHYFGSNEGIAKRLNSAVKHAIENKFDYLLTMDQDSSFKKGDFEKYINYIQAGSYNNVVQFGVNCQPQFTVPSNIPEPVLTLITSGTILNLSFIQNIGAFNENLFIDFYVKDGLITKKNRKKLDYNKRLLEQSEHGRFTTLRSNMLFVAQEGDNYDYKKD